MKLYDFNLAPNPRRVRMFLAEKGITDVPMEEVNTRDGSQFADAFLAINPRGTVPVLALDDGAVLTESVSICRYFEETNPQPALFGSTPTEKALVDNWNRRAEFEGMMSVADAMRNSLPMFADRALAGAPSGVPQNAALAERGKAMLQRWLGHLDKRLGETKFLAGDHFSIADITAFIAFETAKRIEYEVPASYANVTRWLAEVASRPSASA
jgi:glutathione S-transferase